MTNRTEKAMPDTCRQLPKHTTNNTGKIGINILDNLNETVRAFQEQDGPQIPDPKPTPATAKTHEWNIILNHAHPEEIEKALMAHQNPDANKI